ncbi:hypothetical protein C0J52_13559 [Blattella germanica]|nr:hypothetical protein C0J52_13559 [Blattella germanica]
MMPLKLTCSVMVMMVMPSYDALLCVMKPGPGHTSLYLSVIPMSGNITGHHARQWCF